MVVEAEAFEIMKLRTRHQKSLEKAKMVAACGEENI